MQGHLFTTFTIDFFYIKSITSGVTCKGPGLGTDHKIICFSSGNADRESDSIPALMIIGSYLILF